MTYKISHKTYGFILAVFAIITSCILLIPEGIWITIVASIGTGGIASVCVAWLLDVRDTKIRTIENKRKYDDVMNQFVQIYLRMMWGVANQCYGYCEKDESRSFQNWLSLLGSLENVCPKEGQSSLKRRCAWLSGDIVSLQRQIDIFQSQSVTLIFYEFPEIERALRTFEILRVHCWGTLNQFESENYKAFCDTTYILYTDFINAFPQYKDRFPAEYSTSSFKP